MRDMQQIKGDRKDKVRGLLALLVMTYLDMCGVTFCFHAPAAELVANLLDIAVTLLSLASHGALGGGWSMCFLLRELLIRELTAGGPSVASPRVTNSFRWTGKDKVWRKEKTLAPRLRGIIGSPVAGASFSLFNDSLNARPYYYFSPSRESPRSVG